jgi:hypothetical protein
MFRVYTDWALSGTKTHKRPPGSLFQPFRILKQSLTSSKPNPQALFKLSDLPKEHRLDMSWGTHRG